MSNFKETPVYCSYQALLETDVLLKDTVQDDIVQHFGKLQNQILSKSNKKLGFFSDLFGDNDNAITQGLYLHGGVGRGKTFLMDMFYSTTKIDKKHRAHFHEFMLKTHDALHARRKAKTPMHYNKDSALLDYAEELSKKYKLLCLDEMHVKDITDAMILGRLFTKLLELGTFIVFTSNFDVDDLYKGGLQRELFLPFVDLLKKHLDIVHMQSDNDYRLNLAWAEGTWFTPLNNANKEKIENVFHMLTTGKEIQDITISIKGRDLTAYNSAIGVAKFEFVELCAKARGNADYIEICRNFNTVFLLNTPILNDSLRNETRRFINLIDTFYENKIHLIISASTNLDDLYDGKENCFEFDRTLSRLQEMQSKDYWGHS